MQIALSYFFYLENKKPDMAADRFFTAWKAIEDFLDPEFPITTKTECDGDPRPQLQFRFWLDDRKRALAVADLSEDAAQVPGVAVEHELRQYNAEVYDFEGFDEIAARREKRFEVLSCAFFNSPDTFGQWDIYRLFEAARKTIMLVESANPKIKQVIRYGEKLCGPAGIFEDDKCIVQHFDQTVTIVDHQGNTLLQSEAGNLKTYHCKVFEILYHFKTLYP